MDTLKKVGILLVGSFLVYKFFDIILNDPKDTRNYKLLSPNDDILYHGITYDKRLLRRIKEHDKNGKEFFKVRFDNPKTREDARRIEAKRIKRDNPPYNIQHNS